MRVVAEEAQGQRASERETVGEGGWLQKEKGSLTQMGSVSTKKSWRRNGYSKLHSWLEKPFHHCVLLWQPKLWMISPWRNQITKTRLDLHSSFLLIWRQLRFSSWTLLPGFVSSCFVYLASLLSIASPPPMYKPQRFDVITRTWHAACPLPSTLVVSSAKESLVWSPYTG